MAKRMMLFPLEMRNGEKVYTLEELKEKFDIGRALEYADSGRLVKWLRDRKADDIAEKIVALDKESDEYAKGICGAILGEVNEMLLNQIEAAKAKKEQSEKVAAEQLRIKAEKAAEEKRKEEERKKQSPTLLVSGAGIYVVEGSQVRPCKTFPADSRDWAYGVVQEGRDIYYLERSVTAGVIDCFIHRINLETGENEKICGTEEICLCGVRKHRLFYTKELPAQRSYFEIVEMDLDTLEKQVHKIEVPSDCRPIYTWFPYDHISNLISINDYPCIDKNGKHIYCEMTTDSLTGRCYSDINLEDNKISRLISPEIARGGFFGGFIGWGVGNHGFVVWEHEDSAFAIFIGRKTEPKARCIYYDMAKKQIQQLDKLEKAFCASGRPDSICCGDEQIYWMKMDYDSGDTWRFVDEIVITEYNISTDELTERVYLKKADFGDEFDYKATTSGGLDIFVHNRYLYMNKFYQSKSWRFSLDGWKPEKLVRDGQNYKYVPAVVHS